MRTLGRIFFLFATIGFGAWLGGAVFVVVATFKNPHTVSGAMGEAFVPLMLFTISAYFFNKLARKKPG